MVEDIKNQIFQEQNMTYTIISHRFHFKKLPFFSGGNVVKMLLWFHMERCSSSGWFSIFLIEHSTQAEQDIGYVLHGVCFS